MPVIPILAQTSEAAEVLGWVLKLTALGPVKLAVQWNQALIRGWRKANGALEGISNGDTCDAITAHDVSTKAHTFFNELYKARGCEDH